MSCQRKLCRNLIISESVTFTSPNLIINIPAGTYNNGQKYCLVVAQDIPTTTTYNATVGVTIGSDTTIYPLINSNCTNVSVNEIVTKGMKIGISGTNRVNESLGNHLHFEIYQNGINVDPLKVIGKKIGDF